jgi:hypothetical protein
LVHFLGATQYVVQRAHHGSVRNDLEGDLYKAQYLAVYGIAQQTVIYLTLYLAYVIFCRPAKRVESALGDGVGGSTMLTSIRG